MDSFPHPSSHSLATRHTPPWAPPEISGCALKNDMSYPRQFWEYVSILIFLYFRSITSTPLHSTALMACSNPNPLTSRMFSVLMVSPGGHWGRQLARSGAVCRRSAPWGIGWEKLGGIQFGNKRMKEGGGDPRIGYCRIYGRYFSLDPFLISGRLRSRGVAVSDVTVCLVWVWRPLVCIQPRFHL